MANTERGEAECCICHETPPECCIFHTSQVNGASTNLLLFRGRISKMDSQRNAVEQVKEIVSPSLLPQKWEMDLIKKFLTRDLLLWIASGYRVVEFH